MGESILIVDDEEGMLNFLSKFLSTKGYAITVCKTAADFLAILANAENLPDMAIVDYRLPDGNGSQLLAETGRRYPGIKTIIITAYGDVQTAVESMKMGAADFLSKPFSSSDILHAVNRVLEPVRLRRENELLRRKLEIGQDNHSLVYRSGAFAKVVELADKVAKTSATVLLTGETGVGKEIVAQYIHRSDPRGSGTPFLMVNCGALNDNLLETQLFGVVRGAFTGAYQDTPGLFRTANHGTLLLDEIAEASPAVQLKLLRVLENGEVTPVGGTRAYHVDVRIIAATHRDLRRCMETDRFRKDLFYRLQVYPIEIPPLRERPADVMPLVAHYLAWYAAREGYQPLELSGDVISFLESYAWPGNVRELRNLVHRAVIVSSDGIFSSRLLPFDVVSSLTAGPAADAFDMDREDEKEKPQPPFSLKEVESRHIASVLAHFKQNRKKTASALGISEKTLSRWLIGHGN